MTTHSDSRTNGAATGRLLQPPTASAQPTTPAPTKDATQHPERKDSQQPRHDVDATQATAAATVPPCPEWCQLTYDEHDYGDPSIQHESSRPEAGEQVVIGQRVSMVTGSALPAKVFVAADGHSVDATEARVLASHLLVAAAKVDEINGIDEVPKGRVAVMVAEIQTLDQPALDLFVELVASERARRARLVGAK